MNKIAGKKKTGGHFLALVLEPANLQRLREGRPIQIHVEDMFPDGIPGKLDLDILFSATPVADAKAMKDMAEVAFDERAPVTQAKRPHCPECTSTIEQLGVWRNDSPLAIVFCPACGCTLGLAPSEVTRNLPKSENL